jgi:5-hydroxyisourate hydrolase
MSGITTHVLDTARGEPARGVTVTLLRVNDGGMAVAVTTRQTDDDGRVRNLLAAEDVSPGRYRLVFDTGAYHRVHAATSFFPHVMIDFDVTDPRAPYHVPLLLSPGGYTTYRGS